MSNTELKPLESFSEVIAWLSQHESFHETREDTVEDVLTIKARQGAVDDPQAGSRTYRYRWSRLQEFISDNLETINLPTTPENRSEIIWACFIKSGAKIQ